MTCDTGAHGSPDPETTDWVARLRGYADYRRPDVVSQDNPLDFALFGLARQHVDHFPTWQKVKWDMPVLDLGPGNKIIEGAIRCEYPQYNFENLNALPVAYPSQYNHGTGTYDGYRDDTSEFRCTLPYRDNSVGGIYAVNILEHLWDPRPIMEECARVLAPGAPLNIVVPHGAHGIYLQDLDHKKPFILDTWRNWLSNGYWGPDRSGLRLRVGVNFKFGIKEENVNIMTQLIKSDDPWLYDAPDTSIEEF